MHSIAVVGLSPNPARPSFRVAQGLQGFGYRIIPVRPMVDEVLGEKAYPDLESLPELPDIVDVFRAAEHVPAIVESCIKLGIRNLWLQEGVINEEAALRAREAGITVVMDRCMWRDCVQLGARRDEAKAMNKQRCAWAGDDALYRHYHDTEWGVPLHDDRAPVRVPDPGRRAGRVELDHHPAQARELSRRLRWFRRGAHCPLMTRIK